MPLTAQNYENFFLGAAAEYRIASEIYFHGFEATKYTPDFGIDLGVTNAAQMHLKGASARSHALQIKAAFVLNGSARFYMRGEDMTHVIGRDDMSCVFCCVTPHIQAHPQSFHRGDFEPWRSSLDAEMDQRAFDQDFAALRKQHGCLSAIDFKGFDFEYFWFNARQLKRSVDDGYWAPAAWAGEDVQHLQVVLDGDAIEIASPRGDRLRLVPEVRNLYFLLKDNASSFKLAAGAFALDHY